MVVIIWQTLSASDLAQRQPKHESRFEFSSWWRDALNVLITPVWSYASGTSQDWSHRCDRTYEKVKRWTNEAEQDLRACFDCTHWTVFVAAANDLDELTETITSYISYCEDMCILTYNNDKQWFTAKLRQLRQAKQNAYSKGDKVLYKLTKYTLEKEIRVQRGIILKN